MSAAPSFAMIPERMTSSRTIDMMASAAPSTLFSTTLPVKPSVTTTSTSPLKMSRPST